MKKGFEWLQKYDKWLKFNQYLINNPLFCVTVSEGITFLRSICYEKNGPIIHHIDFITAE